MPEEAYPYSESIAQKCPACGGKLPPQAAFCPTCGRTTPYSLAALTVLPSDATFMSSPPAASQQRPPTYYGDLSNGASVPNPYEAQAPYAVPMQAPPPPWDALSSQSATAPRQGRGRFMTKVVPAVIGLVLVIAGIIGTGALVNHTNQVNSANTTATAVARNATFTAGSQLTATAQVAQAHTTATAEANTTATAIASAKATAIARSGDPYPPIGHLVISDPLTSPSHFADINGNTGGCQFTSNGYELTENQQSGTYECNAVGGLSFGNFTTEVKLQFVQAGCGGLVLRDNGRGTADYAFVVCSDGTYNFYIAKGSYQGLLTGSSSAFKAGVGVTNTIAAVANGSTFSLYANGQMITSTSDATYAHGNVGVIAVDTINPVVVVFNNIKVWSL